jgi:hypothetical protein
MLKAEYLGTTIDTVDKFKHLDERQILVTAYPYMSRQNVLNELVANVVFGDRFPCSYRELEIVLRQVLSELPDNYYACIEKDGRLCIKICW